MRRGDVVLLVAQGDMGNPRPGVIVHALRRDRVRQVLGSLDGETSERLNSALMTVLGLAR